MPSSLHIDTERIAEEAFRTHYYNQHAQRDKLIRLSSLSRRHRDICEVPSCTEDALYAPESDIRFYALRILELPWRDQDRFRQACLNLVHDPSQDVAGYAMYGLSEHYTGSMNQDIAKLVACNIVDIVRTPDLRHFAYSVFCSIIGKEYNYFLDPITEQKLQAVVDWKLVKSYSD